MLSQCHAQQFMLWHDRLALEDVGDGVIQGLVFRFKPADLPDGLNRRGEFLQRLQFIGLQLCQLLLANLGGRDTLDLFRPALMHRQGNGIIRQFVPQLLFQFPNHRVTLLGAFGNPAKVRTNLFKKSNIEVELKKFGAKEITLPVVTSITLLAIKRAEAKAGRKLSFAEVATPGASHLELMLAGEMQWAMQQMFRQYDAILDFLVPSEQVPEVEPQPEPAAKPARSKQPMLNLGE